MKRVRKSADERKLEIVQAVIRLVADIGPDKLSTQRIADEIGLTQPAVYRHFSDKNEIWLAVAQHITGEMRAGIRNTMQDNDTALQTLKSLVRAHLEFIEKTPAIPAILFSRELHTENEGLRQYFEGLMKDRQEVFTKLIQNEVDSGHFQTSLNVADAANLVLALVQGLAMRWSLNNHGFELSKEGERLFELQLRSFSL